MKIDAADAEGLLTAIIIGPFILIIFAPIIVPMLLFKSFWWCLCKLWPETFE